MRVTSKGQVTIPKAIREQAGINPGSDVEFAVEDGTVVVRPAPARGRELVDHLRSHREQFTMTTEEVMALTRGEDRPAGAS